MKGIFLVVVALLIGCVSQNSRLHPVSANFDDARIEMPAIGSAANDASYYNKACSAIDSPGSCVESMKKAMISSAFSYVYQINEAGFGAEENGAIVMCAWHSIDRNAIAVYKAYFPKVGDRQFYALVAPCQSTGGYIPIFFVGKADAELFHVLLYRMIDLHH